MDSDIKCLGGCGTRGAAELHVKQQTQCSAVQCVVLAAAHSHTTHSPPVTHIHTHTHTRQLNTHSQTTVTLHLHQHQFSVSIITQQLLSMRLSFLADSTVPHSRFSLILQSNTVTGYNIILLAITKLLQYFFG